MPLMTTQECILMKILDCGICDLSELEDINYDLDDILEDLMLNNDLNFNSILREVFRKGARDLKEVFEENEEDIRSRILEELEEQKQLVRDGEMTQEELEEYDEYLDIINDLELLDSEELDPEEDMDFYTNYLDSHVYMRHIDFYRKWMQKDLDTIEDNMGYEFRDLND